MEPKPCTFCKPGFFDGKDIIYKTDNFGVVASLNPQYAYQGLIIPLAHIRSYGYLPESLQDELHEVKGAVGEAVLSISPNKTVFYHEHGDAETDLYDVLSQSVRHAHLGFRSLPKDLDILTAIEDRQIHLMIDYGAALLQVHRSKARRLEKDDSYSIHSDFLFDIAEALVEGLEGRQSSTYHPGYLYFYRGDKTENEQYYYRIPRKIPSGKGGPVHKFFATLLEEALGKDGAADWESLERTMKKKPEDLTPEEVILLAERNAITERNVIALKRELTSRLG